ncbi:DNA methyltransferase [Sphaerotilus sp.]|uniref:DNA methyltransferase n=1 Tax=Sphaerotilus sp. TaxID=2093942 RepID=UPI002ACD23D2|nr:DNA methyltransferase [Sphaerotilus sp.]MDZ7854935.1 DNA methyltransferase [Sphaerotilus sp.]
MSKHIELVTKLREIFQIDRPDLDFGIYRILNTRAAEINAYLEQRLPEKVRAALAQGGAAQQEQVARELQEKEAQYQADGVDPGTVPKVRELREKLAQYQAGASEHENAVFSHLLAFFSRYYKDGDFISQRRYKGDTYAIPYAGEEVMLHWANKDQYYTKSGENFANYGFKLDDGRTVHFRLVAADTAKDNRKDNDKERRFALVVAKTVTRLDENGDEYEEELVPAEEALGSDGNKELIIRFEYIVQPKGTKQEALVTKAVEAVLADAAVKARWLALGNRAPTEKSPQRTLLEKHLSDYTTKNTADYFIHKDLGGFLRRELDFHIKNEVMHLDDVQNAGAFADIEKNLRMIQCLRAIARELITFLAQLENFQKKLWLKKKFVVSSHYCITLDRVPEALWPEVVANEQQWARWKQLGLWTGNAPGSIKDLQASLFRTVDTSLFEDHFKNRLLSAIHDLDEKTSGLLINSDNFQALSLLGAGKCSLVDFVYIDPPYNAKSSEILYKNAFKHSSWLSLIHNRLSAARTIMRDDAPIAVAIDENEQENLGLCLSNIFQEHHKALITVIHNHKGIQSQNFSNISEFCYFVFPTNKRRYISTKKRDGYSMANLNLRDKGNESLRSDAKTCFYPFLVNQEGFIVGVGNVPADDFHPSAQTEVGADDFRRVWPIDRNGIERKWRYAQSSFERIKDIIKAEPGGAGLEINIYKEEENYKTVWDDSKFNAGLHGTRILNNLIPNAPFDFPKSLHLVYESCKAGLNGKQNGVVLDFFAGSGTTAHAVISLNRDMQGDRKYILVEQGDYFDTVLKPRLQKIVYSSEWNGGEPSVLETGVSHCFKVLKLESYEDTLNNLQLSRTAAQGDLLNTLPQQAKDDYLLNYQLDVESRGSLLSVDDFKKPFDYTLNVAVDSAGAFEPGKIDLVETFNFLIGLRVKHIDAQPQRGFVTVTGTLPSNETCLVLWRDCDVLDYEGISKLCDKLAINPADNEFDVVYINGDHNIPTVLTQTAEEGGATRVLKLRQIEPEFLDRMFSTEDV